MRKSSLLFVLVISGIQLSAQSYLKLHHSAVVVDTHNDFLTKSIESPGLSFDQNNLGKTHSDLQRMKEGGIDIQVFSIWCDGTNGKGKDYAIANLEIDSLYAVVKRNSEKMMMVYNPHDFSEAIRLKKLGAMMGVEGGHMIEDDLSKLDSLYARGVRYMTLTWNNSTSWATSAMFESSSPSAPPEGDSKTNQRKRGLNDFGKEVVKRMNALGMIVDLSHVGEQTFWDAIHTSTRPVIASHSCAYTLCPVFRNLKDDQIKAIGQNGGVIHLNFYSGFLDSNFLRKSEAFLLRHKAEKDSLVKTSSINFITDDYLFRKYPLEVSELQPPLSLLIDHLDYIVKLIGVDHVGLGSDFDGITSSPKELRDVTNMPLITGELVKRGYSKKDIRKILGGNFLRVFRENQH